MAFVPSKGVASAVVAAARKNTWCQDIASHSTVTASDKNLGAQDGAMSDVLGQVVSGWWYHVARI